MADITIVNGVYKPTYNWGAPSCRMTITTWEFGVFHFGNTESYWGNRGHHGFKMGDLVDMEPIVLC